MYFGSWWTCCPTECLIEFLKSTKATNWLGFGDMAVTRSNLSKANQQRDCRIFEEFANHLVGIAQSKRINRIFELKGKFYAFDSTTIDLCLSIFWWAVFRKKIFHITSAKVHDVNAMDEISYEQHAY